MLSYTSEVANLLLMTLLLTSDHPSEVSNLLIMTFLLALDYASEVAKLLLLTPSRLREYPIRLLQTRKSLFSRHTQPSFPLPNHTTFPPPIPSPLPFAGEGQGEGSHYPLSYISPNLRLYSN